MGYKAEVILKSVGPNNIELMTVFARYPRMVHADIMTHRMFSRNAKSSRAKPIRQYVKEVWSDPAEPAYWGAARKGMQAGAEEIRFKGAAQLLWRSLRAVELGGALLFDKMGLHKQVPNRRLESDLYIDTLITGTRPAWSNFYALRSGVFDGAADPSLQVIARMIARADRDTPAQKLKAGEWHLPYVSKEDRDSIISKYPQCDAFINQFAVNELCRVSAARCARLSYFSFNTGKKSTVEEDLVLFEKLINSGLPHASALEHQAEALHEMDDPDFDLDVYREGGNLVGWRQFRKTLPNEMQSKFDLWSVTDDPFIIK